MLTNRLSINLKLAARGLLFFTLLSPLSCDYISRRILTKPVAQVENTKLSTQEFSRELATRLKDFDSLSAKDPKVVATHRDQIINDFIITAIIDLWLLENKILIGREELDAEIKKVSSSYPNDSSFREALNEAGLSFADWSKKMEATVKKKRLLDLLREKVSVPTEAELTSYFNENKQRYVQAEGVLLSHIQVADENQAEIVKKLLRRQKFSEVAEKYSSAYHPEVKDSFGWIEKGFMVDLDRSFRMRVGDTLGPIKLADGLHIFKIIEKKPYKAKTFTEARANVLQDVMSLREQALFSAWLEEQFKRYSIKKNKAVLESIRIETQ